MRPPDGDLPAGRSAAVAPRPGAHRRPAFLAVLLLSASCSLVHQELPNEPPVVQESAADTLRVRRLGRVNLQVTASDADDDPLDYRWTAFGAGSFTDSTRNATTWIAPGAIAGQSELFLIQVTVIDHQPETPDPVESFLVEVVQHPPQLSAPSDTAVSFREPLVVLEAQASDEDADPVTFRWELVEADRVELSVRTPGPNRSQAQLTALVPQTLVVGLMATDGADTLRRQVQVAVEAPPLPEAGMVPLDLPLSGGGVHAFQIDAYEYPNRRGQEPLLVEDWFQAAALCAAEGKRLCTSAEWIYACQGPQGSPVSSTDDPQSLPGSFGLRFCNEAGSSLAGQDPDLDAVAPSGSFPNCSAPAGDGSVGVYDLTGNAFEWMMDIDPQGPRTGRFSLSATAFGGRTCAEGSSLQAAVPPAGEFDAADPAPVDSLRALPEYSGYFESGRGFRCCR